MKKPVKRSRRRGEAGRGGGGEARGREARGGGEAGGREARRKAAAESRRRRRSPRPSQPRPRSPRPASRCRAGRSKTPAEKAAATSPAPPPSDAPLRAATIRVMRRALPFRYCGVARRLSRALRARRGAICAATPRRSRRRSAGAAGDVVRAERHPAHRRAHAHRARRARQGGGAARRAPHRAPREPVGRIARRRRPRGDARRGQARRPHDGVRESRLSRDQKRPRLRRAHGGEDQAGARGRRARREDHQGPRARLSPTSDGRLVAVDDPGLDPVFEMAGKLGMPVAIHTGDPKAFWKPPTPDNERFDELRVHPRWSFFGAPVTLGGAVRAVRAARGAPSEDDVHRRALRQRPRGSGARRPRCSTHRNLYIDTAARVPEIGRVDANHDAGAAARVLREVADAHPVRHRRRRRQRPTRT